MLISDFARTFDVMGWFSPAIIKVKILLQQLLELKVDWDDPLPPTIHNALRSELQQGFIQDFLFGRGNVFSHASTKHVNVGGSGGISPPRKIFLKLASLRLQF